MCAADHISNPVVNNGFASATKARCGFFAARFFRGVLLTLFLCAVRPLDGPQESDAGCLAPGLTPACRCPRAGPQPSLLAHNGGARAPILPHWVSRLVMRICRPAVNHLDLDQHLAPAEKMLKLPHLQQLLL